MCREFKNSCFGILHIYDIKGGKINAKNKKTYKFTDCALYADSIRADAYGLC